MLLNTLINIQACYNHSVALTVIKLFYADYLTRFAFSSYESLNYTRKLFVLLPTRQMKSLHTLFHKFEMGFSTHHYTYCNLISLSIRMCLAENNVQILTRLMIHWYNTLKSLTPLYFSSFILYLCLLKWRLAHLRRDYS